MSVWSPWRRRQIKGGGRGGHSKGRGREGGGKGGGFTARGAGGREGGGKGGLRAWGALMCQQVARSRTGRTES